MPAGCRRQAKHKCRATLTVAPCMSRPELVSRCASAVTEHRQCVAGALLQGGLLALAPALAEISNGVTSPRGRGTCPHLLQPTPGSATSVSSAGSAMLMPPALRLATDSDDSAVDLTSSASGSPCGRQLSPLESCTANSTDSGTVQRPPGSPRLCPYQPSVHTRSCHKPEVLYTSSTPFVVISDHSEDCSSSPAAAASLHIQDPCEKDGADNALMASSALLNTRRSTSSLCSQHSELEADPLRPFALDEEAQKRLKAQMSWKKIKCVIRWSPFIQSYRQRKYPWVQISGHQGNFAPGDQGSILKRHCSKEELALTRLQQDELHLYVPRYLGTVTRSDTLYLRMQDLLKDFSKPQVMDVKMGVRTYLEEELEKARRCPTPRQDMYEKMIEVDADEPTAAEHAARAVTKPRYMQWRESISSSASLGFRIEGQNSVETSSTTLKTTKTREQVTVCLHQFIQYNERIRAQYAQRLEEMRAVIERSQFFREHEVVGSSLLFVHDSTARCGVWLIDFGKTTPLPPGVHVTHRDPWREGNHEEGYLTGMDTLIDILSEAIPEVSSEQCDAGLLETPL